MRLPAQPPTELERPGAGVATRGAAGEKAEPAPGPYGFESTPPNVPPAGDSVR